MLDTGSGAPPLPIQRRENKTGLPDRLKDGLEQLSGIDLSGLQVHYNASKPAQFHAHAFTQGNDIFVAPGQERHLPHEGWHAVQQMQRRVRPTMQLHRVPLNADAALEREADVMGAKAAGVSKASRQTNEHARIETRPSTDSPLQRKPADAIGPKTRQTDPIWNAYDIFEAARLASLAPMGEPTIKTRQYYELIREITEFFELDKTNPKEGAIELTTRWNAGLERGLQIDSDDVIDMYKNQKRYSPKPKNLEEWYKRTVADKRMTAPIKQIELLELLQRSKEILSEDEELMVKMMFKRTAGFNPLGNQGKSLHSKKVYFRSTATDSAKQILSEEVKEGNEEKWKSHTINFFNRGMYNLLEKQKVIKAKVFNFEEEEEEYPAAIAVYKPGFYNIASLGLPTNVNSVVRTLIRMKKNLVDSPMGEEDKMDSADHQELAARISQFNATDGSSINYHDYMLEYASDTVKTVGSWINDNFSGVQAIQSSEHPSLILALAKTGITEKTWREKFIEAFNYSADENGYELRITERNSFGFIYPSASSVGGPVRIWPGLAPREILMNIISHTLDALAKRPELQIQRKIQTRSKKSILSDVNATPSDANTTPIHVEALRTALRFVHRILKRDVRSGAHQFLYRWLVGRLDNNLEKARYLLNAAEENSEHHFLKSAGVIENLMEYSYMLLAQTKRNMIEDPYRHHIEKELPATRKKGSYKIFYLDSGMQAITLASLIAQAFKDSSQPTTVVPESPYFEVPFVFRRLGIKKSTLDQYPDLIVGDLNAVITSRIALEHYSPKNLRNTLKENRKKSGRNEKHRPAPIPILDITNSNLAAVKDLVETFNYKDYIVVESMSKHYHLGTDKFTMGRLIVVGGKLVEKSKAVALYVQKTAGDPLIDQYREIMDEILYGGTSTNQRRQDSNLRLQEHPDLEDETIVLNKIKKSKVG